MWSRFVFPVVLAMLLPRAVNANTKLQAEPRSTEIAGGQHVEECGWPTVVHVGLPIDGTNSMDNCTGTLIHPEVVLMAGHCLDQSPNARISFGEHAAAPVQRIEATHCERSDQVGQPWEATDWAYCRLSRPVYELPVTPIMMGCELDMLTPGREVAIVGYGVPETWVKQWAMTKVVQVYPDLITVGGSGSPAPCPGDSGGPALVQFPDGVWRVAGTGSSIVSSCGSTATYARASSAVPWLERATGLDLTPCHDSDGTWNPTDACGRFSAAADVGTGTWDGWCADVPSLPWSSTCGEPFRSDPDDAAPTVAVSSPRDGQRFDEIPTRLTVEIDADDSDGWGVERVWLQIDDVELPTKDLGAPWAFEGVSFPRGVWSLVALAEDRAGNVGRSAPVVIGVGEDPPSGSGGDESEGGGGTSGDDGSSGPGETSPTDGTFGGLADDGSGCACAWGPGAPRARGLLLGALVVVWGRRRPFVGAASHRA